MNELPQTDRGLLNTAEPAAASESEVEPKVRFSDFDLAADVLECLEDLGITVPTPIQEKVTNPILNGKDVIGKAETGTGKTIGFGAPLVGKIDTSRVAVQALVMTPTRELAQQVAQVLEQLGAKRELKIALVVGGVHASEQVIKIRGGCQVVVGTPGRILDFLKERILSLVWTENLVIDEADRMFDMGFIDDIQKIIGHLPESRQTLLFSATIPPGIQHLMKRHMKDPETYSTSTGLSTVTEIQQSYREVDFRRKFDELRKIIDKHPDETIIVFCNTRRQAVDLDRMLWGYNYPARALHGNHDQEVRFKVLESFRQKEIRILVATDVASRGLDVEDVNLVINFEVPIDVESYVHRIGRTGRASKAGEAITLVAGKEMTTWRRILKSTQFEIKKDRRDGRGGGRGGPRVRTSSSTGGTSSSDSPTPPSSSKPSSSSEKTRDGNEGDPHKKRRRRRRRGGRGGEGGSSESNPRTKSPSSDDSTGQRRGENQRRSGSGSDSSRDGRKRSHGRRGRSSSESSSGSRSSGGQSSQRQAEPTPDVDLFDVSMKDFLDVSRPIEDFKTGANEPPQDDSPQEVSSVTLDHNQQKTNQPGDERSKESSSERDDASQKRRRRGGRRRSGSSNADTSSAPRDSEGRENSDANKSRPRRRRRRRGGRGSGGSSSENPSSDSSPSKDSSTGE